MLDTRLFQLFNGPRFHYYSLPNEWLKPAENFSRMCLGPSTKTQICIVLVFTDQNVVVTS